jgi:hypothetical protein
MAWCDRPPEHPLDAQLALRDEAVEIYRGWLQDLAARGPRDVFDYDDQHILVGHNVAYDSMCWMAYDESLIELVFQVYEADRIEDTLLNQKLIDIAEGELAFRKTRGYNLGEVGRRHGLEVDKEDPWRLRYGSLDGTPLEHWPSDAREYPLVDVTAPWTIWTRQLAQSKAWEIRYGSPILHQAPTRTRADLALALAAAWGLRTNEQRCRLLEEFTTAEIDRMRDTLVDAGLVRMKGRKWTKDTRAAQARVLELFKEQGKEPPLTPAGKVSTEHDTMILLGDEILITYAEYTTASNLLSRCEDLKRGCNLPLQPRYDSLLETGRTSSSKGEPPKSKAKTAEPDRLRGIQVQNFPRGMSKAQKKLLGEKGLPSWVGARECIEPREGNVFVLADYSSAELHTLAQVHIDLFGKSTLAEILNSGRDVHLLFGCEAYGAGSALSYQQIIDQKLKKLEPYCNWRQAAKPIVFGRPGGMGAAKIVITARKSYQVIFDLPEAKRLIRLYDGMIEEMPKYFRLIDGALGGRERGLLRQLRTGRWRGGATYSGMANSYFQGLAADGALAAMFAVSKECYSVPSSALYGFRIVAFVHDEIVLEGPEHLAHDAAMRLQEIMEREMNVFTPDCPTPAEPVVTRIWAKGAEPVFAPDGKLIPWDLKEAA